MALSDLQIFSEKMYDSYQETLAYQLELFNAASQGGLVLTSGLVQGDFSTEAFWARIANLVRRRNVYDPTATLTPTKLGMKSTSKVKIAAGSNPVELDGYQFSWILKSMDEAVMVMSKQLAEESMADMVTTAINAFVAAVGAQSTNVYDGSAGVASLAGLNSAASKMGDRAQDILCWVMNSKSAFDIWGAGIANANQLFTFGTVAIRTDAFGRPLIITDNPALVNLTPNPDIYRTLGLTYGAVVVEQNDKDFQSLLVPSVGKQNIQHTFQAEWTYNLSLKGFTWDTTNGGASPSDAALATATNWDKVATSHKDLAGILANFQ